jgi:hypothetical protein
MACSEGGRVKVNSGSVTMMKSLRKRTAAARSEVKVEAAECSRVGIEDGRSRQWRDGF